MKIRAGYEISYDCPQPTPMILTLSVYPSRTPDLLNWTLANFRCSETAVLQVFLMPVGIFARSRARPGPTKNSVYPYILGRFAHPPLQKLAKVKLRGTKIVGHCTMSMTALDHPHLPGNQGNTTGCAVLTEHVRFI